MFNAKKSSRDKPSCLGHFCPNGSRCFFPECRSSFAADFLPFYPKCPFPFATLGHMPPVTFATRDICLPGTNATLNQHSKNGIFAFWLLPAMTFAILDICRPGTFATLGHLPSWDICHSKTFAVLTQLYRDWMKVAERQMSQNGKCPDFCHLWHLPSWDICCLRHLPPETFAALKLLTYFKSIFSSFQYQ